MNYFNLPSRTVVNRVVPKNAFDSYINTKQKKLFTDRIQRITWTHKLSTETINLGFNEIQEIQLFRVELKMKSDVSTLLEIINKSIPYNIVFWVEYKKEFYISTASKHPHPTNDDIAVIDWTFSSDWESIENNPFKLNLSESLDVVFKDLCVQLTDNPDLHDTGLTNIVVNQQEIHRLKNEIKKLSASVAKSKQFNRKVELNKKLNLKKKELHKLMSNDEG
ncbi:DUF4391 domain-containing protein [Muricauda sp. HICW]|uniref:DUF4391 domain-containing protein n=1 Tax=Flagellimonas chongwuensis TaxID=2697365 RepID=A0A850NE68_9FLAO|nr:DUF4391 domain-containing protein [Allomuricauda chongwuensis]NVN19441.1 DUF4391 domain-containing protein [Allomuricauda chongwuensis]